MALSWADAKRLVRLNGLAGELLTSARSTTDGEVSDGIDRQLVAVAREVQDSQPAHACGGPSEPGEG